MMFKIHHLLKVISLYVILVTLLNSTINGVFGKLIELTDKNLDELVKDDDKWLLQFYTEDCKICTSFRENLEKLSELPESEFGTVINFGLVNANKNPHLVSRFSTNRNPQYYFIDKKTVYTFSVIQTYEFFHEFLKYHRWMYFPKKKGRSDPFSNFASFTGYFNYVGYFLKNYVFIYIPAQVFYSIIVMTFISILAYYSYRKHLEFEKYINEFEKNMEQKLNDHCLKYGYDPFAIIEEMDKKLKEKEETKKLKKN
ncbi:hypothetical protein H8356DRAFT_1739783 [Neocallimastix lanati (nom. inval.)]|uniref:Thioredoxin domain-containing protein n=1 Tax=Neocallimastix californiae TaxID=1754190 RepID=A0A1Y2DDE9_9FUNG|nr:hypothetical protein H8356DRAFT_1739783 [Neocallimastix sp. JGI-2020a]ORY56725.1 hypothetical protein LY90DRAFT_701740 [Neocallimastix californiae]|eukprot:ORY56725.1 hypothetical protein LY90DRAFT_701740 [Neocallimastix californiae]